VSDIADSRDAYASKNEDNLKKIMKTASKKMKNENKTKT
jgi:hypothetical protein